MNQCVKEPRPGRKALFGIIFFRPCRGFLVPFSFQGFASLTPGYFLAPLRGCHIFLPKIFGSESQVIQSGFAGGGADF
jgi:hypothetical protein